MANTFKKIIKKHKKKKLQAERNRKAKARERAEEEYADDYERRLSRHKRSVVKKTVITVVAIAAAVTAVGFYIEKRSYHTAVYNKSHYNSFATNNCNWYHHKLFHNSIFRYRNK